MKERLFYGLATAIGWAASLLLMAVLIPALLVQELWWKLTKRR
jgi:hypothetical protein